MAAFCRNHFAISEIPPAQIPLPSSGCLFVRSFYNGEPEFCESQTCNNHPSDFGIGFGAVVVPTAVFQIIDAFAEKNLRLSSIGSGVEGKEVDLSDQKGICPLIGALSAQMQSAEEFDLATGFHFLCCTNMPKFQSLNVACAKLHQFNIGYVAGVLASS